MPSTPCTTNSHQLPMTESALERRATADAMLQAQLRTPVEASTIIAIVFGFAAVLIIATSACIIYYHRRHQQPLSIPETMPGWRRNSADADRRSDSMKPRVEDTQQQPGTKQVPMLQPMAFLQGREGPKEFVGGGGKRRSSGLPRLISDGMGGIWPRRHSVYTINSSYAVVEGEVEQGGTLSRPVSKRSHRSKRSSKATIGRKNSSHLSTGSAMLATTVQMQRTITKKPSVTTSEPPPALPAPPSAFPAPRLSRNTLASTNSAPSPYKQSRVRSHQGDSFMDNDIREDELETNYTGSVVLTASSSRPQTADLTAFPVSPLPALNIRHHANNH